ncbi:response regulator [Thiocapsa roseopersicina]|uniref:Response regulator receiver domain-containing protein n=1 Tax=Thiocapsa roseopersicina TaxID=1058 RepID=A0A1H3CTQ2_THIRO|nr:response regulator [Thiocapsa roseopersicina]SDX57622.1 Response regulator receiver domain-containing protein [Thiocapsa roseopersicina]
MSPTDAVDRFTACQGRRPRVLLVEDDRALGRMLTWTFEEHGARLLLARTCAAARTIAAAAGFDLAIVDADLPDGDGVMLAEALRADHPAALVAICSGRHGIDRSGLLPPAVDAVLIKPVPIRLLLDLMETVCRTAADVVPGIRHTRECGDTAALTGAPNTCRNSDLSASS